MMQDHIYQRLIDTDHCGRCYWWMVEES